MNIQKFRCSDKFKFQLALNFVLLFIILYYIILGGCPCIISCVVIYKL